MHKDIPLSHESAKTAIPTSIGPEVVALTIATPEDTEKLAQIRGLITADFNGENPEALFPLSGSITQRESGKWTTLNGSDVSEHGLVTVGRARVVAAAKVADIFPEVPIIANSYNRFDPHEPTMASVVKDELVQRKVDPDRIILEEDSFSTITQFTEMIKMAVQKDWHKITVLTNEYNLPRATMQFDNLDSIVDDAKFQEVLQTFKERGGTVSIIDADTIMRIVSDHFASYLDQVSQTEPYKETIRREKQGLEDLKKGEYRVVLDPEKPRK
jgi:hypothetical protein